MTTDGSSYMIPSSRGILMLPNELLPAGDDEADFIAEIIDAMVNSDPIIFSGDPAFLSDIHFIDFNTWHIPYAAWILGQLSTWMSKVPTL